MTLKQRCNRFITTGFEHGDDIFLLRRLVLITNSSDQTKLFSNEA